MEFTRRAFLGEIDVQAMAALVHADYRRLGLGRSILTEAVRRLHAYGARSIYIETDNYRDEAFMLYESVGFRVAHDVLVYRQEYT